MRRNRVHSDRYFLELQWTDFVTAAHVPTTPFKQKIFTLRPDQPPLTITKLHFHAIIPCLETFGNTTTASAVDYALLQNFAIIKNYNSFGSEDATFELNMLTPGGPAVASLINDPTTPGRSTDVLIAGQLLRAAAINVAWPSYGIYPNVTGLAPGATATAPTPWIFPPGSTDPRYALIESGNNYTSSFGSLPPKEYDFCWEGNLPMQLGDGITFIYLTNFLNPIGVPGGITGGIYARGLITMEFFI